jgi:hypothetical protein
VRGEAGDEEDCEGGDGAFGGDEHPGRVGSVGGDMKGKVSNVLKKQGSQVLERGKHTPL